MQQLIERIQRMIERIYKLWRDFIDTVNRTLARVPDVLSWVRDRLLEAWDGLTAKANEFFAKIGELLERFGDPFQVGDVASRWNPEIGAPAAAAAAEVTTGQLYADDGQWVGSTADAYRNRVSEQQATLNAIRDEIAVKVASSLNSMQIAMWTFYTALAGALATFIACLVGGLASAATIFGLPATPFIIGAGFVVAIAAITGAGFLFGAHASTQADALRTTLTSAKVTKWPNFVV